MPRLGICDKPNNIDLIADAGFDYLEIGLAWLSQLSEERYQQMLQKVRESRIGVEACNGMLPPHLKIVGPDVSEQAIREYLDFVLARAVEMGARMIVFGSGPARSVPEGFPHCEAWRQIADFLKLVSEYCVKYDIEAVIEPLRRVETNIINLVSEAVLMVSLLDLPRVGVLGDTYHMVASGEPYSVFPQAGKLLRHVHICNSAIRRYPAEGDDGDYEEVFRELKKCGYSGRVSIEARYDSMEKEAAPAYRRLHEAMKKIWDN